jgi:hypothetical protein
MKTIILSFFLLAVFSNIQAQEQLQSMVEQWYRNGAWEVDDGENYQYDQNGNIKSVVFLNWNGSSWENNFRSLYEFNANNTIANFTYQDWSVNGFENEDRFVFKYDQNGDQVEELVVQTWNGIQWVVGGRYVFNYNPAGRIVETRIEEWDGQWENIERATYDYSNGTVLLYEEWDGIQWLVFEKREYTYNIDGRVISETWYDWTSGQWEEDRRYERQYDAAGNLLQEDEYTSGELSGRDECRYDLSKELSAIDHFFEEPFLAEVLKFPENFPYVNKVLSRTTLNYNKSANRLEPLRREVYNYEQKIMTSSQDLSDQPNLTGIYPNPVGSQINLEGDEFPGAPYSILNMAGRTIVQGKIGLDNSLGVDGLPSGTYVLNIDNIHFFKFLK